MHTRTTSPTVIRSRATVQDLANDRLAPLSWLIAVLVICMVVASAARAETAEQACAELFDYSAPKLRSKETVDFCAEFAGKPLLVINTASQCGFTPQFRGLEELNKRYEGKLNIVGFPSDDFNQELDDSEGIGDVCYLNYGVTFTMLEPSAIKGEGANALYQKLITMTGETPSWNFNKYLISPNGASAQHFASSVTPTSDELVDAIERLVE